jgi:tetratricopeptide (TPR) repeat protein
MTNNYTLLYRLAELMLEHEQHILPVDLLFDDEKIGDFVKSIQIDSPYQQMLLEGVLTESVKDEKLYVSFTVEGYFHLVLGEVLLHSFTEKPNADLLTLVRVNRLNGIREGVTQCLLRRAQKGEIIATLDFIDAGEEYARLCVIPLGVAFTTMGVAEVLSALLANESEHDYVILDAVIEFLKQNNRHEKIEEIWGHLSTYLGEFDIEFTFFSKAVMMIRGMAYKEQEFIEAITEKIIASGKSYFKKFDHREKLGLQMTFYNLLVDKGMLPAAYQFAKRFGIYDFDSKELVNNYYNILYPLLELGDFPKAEQIYQRCEPDHGSDGFFLNWSGWIYQSWYELKSDNQVHLEKGLELYNKSTALIDYEYGRFSLRKYQNLENLGYTYNLIGQYDKGFSYLDAAIEILTKSYRTDIVYNLGNLYEMKANALLEIQRHEEALSYMDKADQCKLLQVGDDTSEMAWNYQTRANILAAMGRKAEAKTVLKKALDIRVAELGEDNQITVDTRDEYEGLD